MFDKKVNITEVYGATNYTKEVTPKVISVKSVKPYVSRSARTYKEYRKLRLTDEFKAWKRKQFGRQAAQCYYCQISLVGRRTNVEHKIPMSKGGTNKYSNLVISCAQCNRDKGSTLLTKQQKNDFKQIHKQKRKLYQMQSLHQSKLAKFYRDNL